MSSAEWKYEMERLQRDIEAGSGDVDFLKSKYYDAERKYEEALGQEAREQYAEVGWF